MTTPIDWLFLMINNPNQDQDFATKLYNKAKQLEDNFAIGFYEFVNNEFIEIKGMYDYKNTSYWNFNEPEKVGLRNSYYIMTNMFS